jgi:hypothetical protein
LLERARGGGLVKIYKESKLAIGTHKLERAEFRASQDIGKKQGSKGHSLPGEAIGTG